MRPFDAGEHGTDNHFAPRPILDEAEVSLGHYLEYRPCEQAKKLVKESEPGGTDNTSGRAFVAGCLLNTSTLHQSIYLTSNTKSPVKPITVQD